MRKLMILLVVLVAPAVMAATPSEGQPLQVRRGFFTETDIGGFFTVGGMNYYSNLQTYLQLGVGYQLTIGDGKGLIPIGLHVAIAPNAQNCHNPDLNADGSCKSADNFTLTFVSLTGGYLHRVVERLYVGGKLMGGLTIIDPDPYTTATGFKLGANMGVAASLEYSTNMDHFSIGLDVGFRLVLGGSPPIMALAFYPRVQYTF